MKNKYSTIVSEPGKTKNLAKEEQRLISLLSMADEEDNQERIRELTDQLMKVQKERKTNSRGI